VATTNLDNNGVRDHSIIIFFMPYRPRSISGNHMNILHKLGRRWCFEASHGMTGDRRDGL
jgi:hypothetical protein